mmetsp:Transcript_28130/g.70659  ORF Transcript_28130/g.70659 Transcript_28130/m.70659 type:complete len:230 (-) Transcript_28130:495-1184(-)
MEPPLGAVLTVLELMVLVDCAPEDTVLVGSTALNALLGIVADNPLSDPLDKTGAASDGTHVDPVKTALLGAMGVEPHPLLGLLASSSNSSCFGSTNPEAVVLVGEASCVVDTKDLIALWWSAFIAAAVTNRAEGGGTEPIQEASIAAGEEVVEVDGDGIFTPPELLVGVIVEQTEEDGRRVLTGEAGLKQRKGDRACALSAEVILGGGGLEGHVLLWKLAFWGTPGFAT